MASEKNTAKKDEEKEKPVIAKTPADLQRIRLEKLMKNPDKVVIIPPRPKEKNSPHVPEFVRNVMGSSAGAGSGEFHVYRHLRRKEYARQKFIQEKAGKELLEEEYHKKVEENRKKAEELTAKKRAKRLKKKKNKKKKFDKPRNESNVQNDSESSDEASDNEEIDAPAPKKSSIQKESEEIDVSPLEENLTTGKTTEKNNDKSDSEAD